MVRKALLVGGLILVAMVAGAVALFYLCLGGRQVEEYLEEEKQVMDAGRVPQPIYRIDGMETVFALDIE